MKNDEFEISDTDTIALQQLEFAKQEFDKLVKKIKTDIAKKISNGDEEKFNEIMDNTANKIVILSDDLAKLYFIYENKSIEILSASWQYLGIYNVVNSPKKETPSTDNITPDFEKIDINLQENQFTEEKNIPIEKLNKVDVDEDDEVKKVEDDEVKKVEDDEVKEVEVKKVEDDEVKKVEVKPDEVEVKEVEDDEIKEVEVKEVEDDEIKEVEVKPDEVKEVEVKEVEVKPDEVKEVEEVKKVEKDDNEVKPDEVKEDEKAGAVKIDKGKGVEKPDKGKGVEKPDKDEKDIIYYWPWGGHKKLSINDFLKKNILSDEDIKANKLEINNDFIVIKDPMFVSYVWSKWLVENNYTTIFAQQNNDQYSCFGLSSLKPLN